MTFTSDEQLLRAALHDATLDQPAAPTGRADAARRRHTRRLALQGGVAVAAAAAVLVGVLTSVDGSRPSGAQQLQQPAAESWRLTWPARYADNSDQAVAHRAALRAMALAYYQAHLGAGLRDVRVLYSDRPSGMAVDWVVVEGSSGQPETHQLVALASKDEGVTWTSYTMQAPPPLVHALGFAMGSRVFALAAPDVRTVGYVDLSSGSSVHGPQTPVRNGVAILSPGHAVAPNTVFVGDHYDSPFPVWWRDGSRGSGQLRAWQKAIRTPSPGDRYLGFFAGAGRGGSATIRIPRDGKLVLVLRCAGPAALQVTVAAPAGGGQQDQDGCDGTSTSAAAALDLLVRRGQKVTVSPVASDFTVYAVAIFLRS